MCVCICIKGLQCKVSFYFMFINAVIMQNHIRIQFSTTQVTFQMASTYDLWQFVYQIAQPEYFHKVQS